MKLTDTERQEIQLLWDTGAQSLMYACQCKGCGKIKKFSVKT